MTDRRRVVTGLVQAAAAAVAVMATAVWGYAYIFTRFSWYDDEGYVLMSVRQFVEGRSLYDEVFSQYGPFYYLGRLGLHAVTQAPLTHDITRLTTLVIWIGIAALLALAIFRMSRSTVAALACYLLVFHHLRPLAHEPGHPQELTLLLVAALVCVASWWNSPQRASAVMAVAGFTLAALTLTKINVGVYAALSMALAVATLASTPRRAEWSAAIACFCVVLPWAVMRRHVADWASGYAAIVSLSALAVALICSTILPRPLKVGALSKLGWAACGTLLVTVAVVLYWGTSVAGLVKGVVLQPLGFAEIVSTEVRFAKPAIVFAVISVLAAFSFTLVQKRGSDQPTTARRVFWGFKLFSGVLCAWLSVSSTSALFAVGPALLWLVVIHPLSPPRTWQSAMPRVVLAAIASLQTMQAYPMAGSQVSWATFLLIPAAVLCVADAVAELSSTMPTWAGVVAWPYTLALEVVVVLGLLIAHAAHYDAFGALQRYRTLSALSLPGASRIRLTPAETERYRWLVSRVRQHCDSLITLPGFNSLYLWTALEPPTGLNTTAWPVLLNEMDQQRIVDAVLLRPKVCVIEYPAGIRTYGREHEVSQLPLMRFIRDAFQIVGERDGYLVKVRR